MYVLLSLRGNTLVVELVVVMEVVVVLHLHRELHQPMSTPLIPFE